MIKALFMYPNKPGAKFDYDYYVNKHMPMVKEKLAALGAKGLGAEKGLSGMEPGSPAPYVAVGYVQFDSVADFQKAMAAKGQEIMADIPNYTDIEPQVQIGQMS